MYAIKLSKDGRAPNLLQPLAQGKQQKQGTHANQIIGSKIMFI